MTRWLLLVWILLFSHVPQLLAFDSITVSGGRGNASATSARLALVQDLDPLGFNQFFSNLGLQLEYSASRLRSLGEHHDAFGILPVVRWSWHPQRSWHWFVDFGIGASYHEKTQVADHQLGSHLLFEDRVGLGVRHERWLLALRGYHYSNGNLQTPNDGLNLLTLELNWQFP